MPPKKKKSGGKKKGKKSGKTSAPPVSQVEQLNEQSKEFYNVQIKDLENRTTRYQAKCDELEVANGEFRKKEDEAEEELKVITKYWKREYSTLKHEKSDLLDRLKGLQQTKDKEKDSYENELQKLRTEFQETKDNLTSEKMKLEGKVAALEEFRVQKEDIMAKMARLEQDLVDQDKAKQEEIYNLEKKQVKDKDRLKKEMVQRVNQVAAEFRKVSNKQMAETTKRTIRENVSINAQLAKMSDKTMELIQDADEAKMREKKQKQQIDLLEANEKELAKKNHSNQKIIRMLTEKCKQQEDFIASFEAREEQYAEMEAESDLLRQQVESTRDELQILSKENEQFEEDLSRVKQELEEERKNKQKLERVLRDSAMSLKAALMTSSTEDVDESPHDVMEKRDNMLENLLILLNSAAALGVGPTPQELRRQRRQEAERGRAKSISPMPGSGKGIRKGEMPMSPIARGPAGTEPHYQLGDLGLIPRPKDNIPTNFEKMKELSATTRLGSLKKVLTRSVAVQTVSSAKAMFFADQLLSKLPNDTEFLHESQKHRSASSVLPNLSGNKRVSARVF